MSAVAVDPNCGRASYEKSSEMYTETREVYTFVYTSKVPHTHARTDVWSLVASVMPKRIFSKYTLMIWSLMLIRFGLSTWGYWRLGKIGSGKRCGKNAFSSGDVYRRVSAWSFSVSLNIKSYVTYRENHSCECVALLFSPRRRHPLNRIARTACTRKLPSNESYLPLSPPNATLPLQDTHGRHDWPMCPSSSSLPSRSCHPRT